MYITLVVTLAVVGAIAIAGGIAVGIFFGITNELPCLSPGIKEITLGDWSVILTQEGEWSSWEKQPCSATCGEGKTVEQRFCGTICGSRV